MKDIFDLVIVGAGPAGLMTAKRASELGLKVIIIELKKDISKVKRACSSQFVTDYNYENEHIKVENNKIKFPNNNFEINYTGPLLNIIDNFHHSPSGYKIHFAHPDHRSFAIKFDKGHLLSNLWNECEKLGVKLMLETIAYNGKDLGDYVKIDVKNHNKSSSILGRKLVIAEGANSKLTGIFGFNKNRKYYGSPLIFSCIMENTTGFTPQSWNQFYSSKYHPFAEIMIESALEGNNAIELTIMGTKDLRPNILFDKFINESPMSYHFTNSKIIEKRGYFVKSFDSLKKPYNNNVLIIGDSAAHVEVIVQGALMCGYHAANAVNDELNNKNGFEEYTIWWNKSFDFNHGDPLEFVKLYGALGMRPNYCDDELDYMFSLLENEILSGDFSQFQIPKTVWKSILSHKSQIQSERPELWNKIIPIDIMNSHGKLD